MLVSSIEGTYIIKYENTYYVDKNKILHILL